MAASSMFTINKRRNPLLRPIADSSPQCGKMRVWGDVKISSDLKILFFKSPKYYVKFFVYDF